ncbi:S-protein homolog 1-like [Momordica charantia]|uniref:S-protein homolog n=1 Tax=Momordica charantia TaxID=3673 RepID=A0A6J1CQ65_MOMCH|nr:S-protein homolog 1-like [Momordica charantia]
MGANVVLLAVLAALTVAQPFVEALAPTPYVDKWHVHVVNGLSNATLFAHCKSRDTDLGEHNLNRGAEIQWSFKENVWGTTLFWCFLKKPGGSASFDVFWREVDHLWLHYRCTNDGTCIWTAKDDGIYIRNIPDNLDELVHKWTSS